MNSWYFPVILNVSIPPKLTVFRTVENKLTGMELLLSGNDRKPEGMGFTNHINSLFSTIINCIIAVCNEINLNVYTIKCK